MYAAKYLFAASWTCTFKYSEAFMDQGKYLALGVAQFYEVIFVKLLNFYLGLPKYLIS